MIDILSAHISGDGDVVAITKDKTYVYAHKLSELQQKKLLAKLSKVNAINLEFWIEEIDLGQSN